MPPVHFMQELGALRRELMDTIREAVSEVARWSTVSASSSTGESDAVDGWALPDEPSSQQRTRRVEPWGLRGRPVAGITAAVLRVFGRASQALLLGTGGERYGRQDLAVGEVQLYCIASGCEVFLDKNGAVFIVAATGQLVKVSGGTDFMVKGTTYRNAEHTFFQALQAFLTAQATGWTAMATGWTAMQTALTALGNPAGATAAGVASTAAGVAAAAATTASTAAGAMEAGASSYLSTKAKVG